MTTRHNDLLAIRPAKSYGRITENTSNDERFQNETLRPIIKFQKDLVIEVLRNYIKKHKSTFHDLTVPKKIIFIESAIQKDIKFRNSIKGIIIGQFTVAEYLSYIENSSALNKRMMDIIKNQLINNIQVFDNQIAKAV